MPPGRAPWARSDDRAWVALRPGVLPGVPSRGGGEGGGEDAGVGAAAGRGDPTPADAGSVVVAGWGLAGSASAASLAPADS